MKPEPTDQIMPDKVEHVGPELLKFLREDFPPFSSRSMFNLVWGGLRVRMSRSMVTLSAVILAIALLATTLIGTRVVDTLTVHLVAIEEGADVAVGDEAGGAPGIEEAQRLRLMLQQAGAVLEADDGDFDKEELWLNFMVLLLCTVGITNAMLMSVTERFWEIGTMKCLGANDYLIVKMFLLESACLGLVGALFGVLVGALLSMGIGIYLFSGYIWVAYPWWSLPGITLAGMVAGVLLAVLGAIYPALVAARMRPVEALRVEE